MGKTTLLGLSTVCPHCGGSGYVTNPVWVEWIKKRKQDPELPVPAEDEEIECKECGGSGEVPTEAGEELMRFLFTHFMPVIEWKFGRGY